jgi:hypothetical protein
MNLREDARARVEALRGRLDPVPSVSLAAELRAASARLEEVDRMSRAAMPWVRRNRAGGEPLVAVG